MIELTDVSKTYGHGDLRTVVLDRVTFRVEAAEIFAVVGPSGAGKSTLAQYINLLTPPTSGSVVVNGADLTTLSAGKLRVADPDVHTAFQSAGLLERRTAAENVALPLEYLGVTTAETLKRVAELMDRVGLAERAGHYPFQLYAGQRQRVDIAGALALAIPPTTCRGLRGTRRRGLSARRARAGRSGPCCAPRRAGGR